MRAQLVIVVTEDLPGQDPTQAELLAQLEVSSTGDLFADVDTPTPLDQPVDPSTGDIYFEAAQTVTVSVVGGGVVVTKNFAAPSGSSPSPRIIDVSPDQLTLSGSAGGGLASGSGTSLVHVAVPIAFDDADLSTPGASFAITAVDGGLASLGIAGDHTAAFPAGTTFTITGSTGNDGIWAVDSVVFGGGTTTITTTQVLSDGTVDGNVNLLIPGVVLYTPAIGDILVDAWVEIGTMWDCAAANFDLGTYKGGVQFGLFDECGGSLQVDINHISPDGEMAGAGVLIGITFALSQVSVIGTSVRGAPSRFIATNPLRGVVSVNGRADSTDPGATAGAATVHLLILPAT